MAFLVQLLAAAVIGAMAAGSLLNLSRHPHWFVRGWEFFRLQIVVVTTAAALVFFGFGAFDGPMPSMPSWASWSVGLTAAVAVAWHLSWIARFTVVFPRSVQSTPAEKRDDAGRLRLLATNVEMDNRNYARWQEVILAADADVILAVEVDDRWVEATRSLQDQYEYRVIQAQDNCYGMMLLSRLPLKDAQVRFLVEDDIPSIHATVVLRNKTEIQLRCVHPRPPEPIRDEDSHHRDAELVVVGRELAKGNLPAIVCGDLNDVAWSHTTRLFLKLSEMLDPRVGRGMYNTWHARHWTVRIPLDHIFHASCFTLRKMQRLEDVGSDHFPIFVDLQHTPELRDLQPPPAKEEETEQEAQEIVEYEKDRSNRPIQSEQQEPVDSE